MPPSRHPLERCVLTKWLRHISLTINIGLDPENIGQSIMMACKVAPSAEPSSEDVSSLKSHRCTPEDAAARDKDALQELHPAWVFSPCSSAEKSSVTSFHTTNKSQATATPFSRSLFDVQHKMSVCSPSDCIASSHWTASGPPPRSNVQPRQPRAQL